MNSDELVFFKLKKEYFTGFEVFEIAKKTIGDPVSINYSENFEGVSTSCEWQFNPRGSNRVQLTIDKHFYGELSINLKKEFAQSEFIDDSWKLKLKHFRSEVMKPWVEWTEEEILCDPMWIYFFFESNSIMPVQFHNAMVLYSYKDIKNYWVKRYFNAKNKESRCCENNSR